MELSEMVRSEKVDDEKVKKGVEKMKYYDEVMGMDESGK